MYRAFLNAIGTITTENMPPDYQAAVGEVLFTDYPSDAELDAAFPAIVKPRLKEVAAAKRYALETGGYTLGGTLVDTDRGTQTRITQANVLAENDPTLAEVSWKASSGFVVTPVATLHAIGIAVGRFVQACYAAEAAIGALIDAGTIADEAAIEAWDGWPAASSGGA